MKGAKWQFAQSIFEVVLFSILLPVALYVNFGVHVFICLLHFPMMLAVCFLSTHPCRLASQLHSLSPPDKQNVDWTCLVCRFLNRHPFVDGLIAYAHYSLVAACYINQAFFKFALELISTGYMLFLVVFYVISSVIMIETCEEASK